MLFLVLDKVNFFSSSISYGLFSCVCVRCFDNNGTWNGNCQSNVAWENVDEYFAFTNVILWCHTLGTNLESVRQGWLIWKNFFGDKDCFENCNDFILLLSNQFVVLWFIGFSLGYQFDGYIIASIAHQHDFNGHSSNIHHQCSNHCHTFHCDATYSCSLWLLFIIGQ